MGFKTTSFRTWDNASYQPTDEGLWSGFYIAEKEATAKGYIPDFANAQGSGDAFVQVVSFNREVKVISYFDDSFKTGNINKKKIFEDLKKEGIDLDPQKPLMPQLGEKGYAFRGYNNEEGDIEIIMPNKMVSEVDMLAYKEVKIKNFEEASEKLTDEWKQNVKDRINTVKENMEDCVSKLDDTAESLAAYESQMTAEQLKNLQTLGGEIQKINTAIKNVTDKTIEAVSKEQIAPLKDCFTKTDALAKDLSKTISQETTDKIASNQKLVQEANDSIENAQEEAEAIENSSDPPIDPFELPE